MATQESQSSIPLITVRETHSDEEDKFVLNPEAISMIEQLSSPIKVIAAIGDARVGKSTALNFIHHSNIRTAVSDATNAEEIFETGDTMEPVTHGIWIAKPNGEDEMENVILLDVEGTDLGDDTVTDKLSIFTALTSSTLMLFMKESPSTHILDFLYKIVRLSEVAFGKKETEHFPRLTAVLRGALAAPKGYKSIEEYIIHALISPTWKDESDNKRQAIETRFPIEKISVFNLPYDPTLIKAPQSSKILEGSEYLKSIETLTEHISQSEEKRSLDGVVLDGQALVKLAKNLVKVMNDEKLWDELDPSFYKLFEEDLCIRSYEKYIEPLLYDEHTAQYIEDHKDEKLRLFRENCKMEKCIMKAEMDINNAIRVRRERERHENMVATAIRIARGAAGVLVSGLVVGAGIGFRLLFRR